MIPRQARRVLLPAILLLLSTAAAPAAAAAEPYLDFDVSDPEGDTRDSGGEPVSGHPYADVVRFQVRRSGDQIEEIVTLAGPVPTGQGYNEDFSIQIANDVSTGSQRGQISVNYQIDNDTRSTSVHETFSSPSGRIGGEIEIEGNLVTARFNASELDAFPCFFPVSVSVFYSTGVTGDAAHPTADAKDSITLSPNLCKHPQASPEGFAGGACSASAAPAGYEDAIDAGADADVPDGADVVSVRSAWSGDRATDTVTYAGDVPLDDVEIQIEHKIGRADPQNVLSRAPGFLVFVTSNDGELSASAVRLNGSREEHLFPVFVEVDGNVVTASWCGAATPAFDCHEIGLKSLVDVDGREVLDRALHGFNEGACSGDAKAGSGSGPDASGGSGTGGGSDGGGSGSGGSGAQDNDAPAPGALAIVALVVALALVTRRRRA